MNLDQSYKLFELDSSATKEDIKKKYRKLAAKYHPDVNKEKDSDKKIKEINEAYEILKNRNSHTNDGSNDIFSIYDFFKNSTVGHGAKKRKKVVTDDIVVDLTISFVESVEGCSKHIEYKRYCACDNCNGEGFYNESNGCKSCNGTGKSVYRNGPMEIMSVCRVCKGRVKVIACDKCDSSGQQEELKSVTVNIPPGACEQKNVLKLGGAGNFIESDAFMERRSNVFLKIKIEPLDGLKIQDTDVVLSLEISLKQAIYGDSLDVPTAFGKTKIEIPKLSKNKDEVIIKNYGVSRVGNQRIILNVSYPDNIEDMFKALEKSLPTNEPSESKSIESSL